MLPSPSITPTGGADIDVFAANAGDRGGCRLRPPPRALLAASTSRSTNAATNPYIPHDRHRPAPGTTRPTKVNLPGRSGDTGGLPPGDGRARWMRDQHRLDRWPVGRGGDRSLQRDQGRSHPPHPFSGQGAQAGVRQRHLPGLVKTDMARAPWESNGTRWPRTPLRRSANRPTSPRPRCSASDGASWITGTTMVVDGGMLL